MEKLWLKSYPEGIKSEVDIDAYQSVADVFNQAVDKFSDLPAFCNMGTTLSYDDMGRLTTDLAAYLQSIPGMKKGDRVAVMMPNLLQNPIAIFAILKAGFTVVNTNPLYTARELRHQLKDSGTKVIIVVDNFCDTLEAVVKDTDIQQVVTTQLGDMLKFPKSMIVNLVVKYVKKMVPAYSIPGSITFKQALSIGASKQFIPVQVTHDDLAFLQYTGGTTGLAKGAMLTNRNMVANMQQSSEWISQLVEKRKEIIITALPLYHIFSLTANCLVFMKEGALNYLITNPRDMPGFVKELSSVKFTAITGVNTLFNGLLNTEGFKDIDFASLKLTLGGGMAVQEAVAEHWRRVTGSPLLEAYGLTETSPAVCMNPMNLGDFNGSIGLPVPSTEVSIRTEDGEFLPQGESGELCVRGPQVMKGYWDKPEETAFVLDEKGWLKTGDIAIMDEDGFFKIVDRKKDMILVSGFNVFPNEIESVIASCPGVLEVGVIGVEDGKSGEAVKAVIVRNDDSLTEKEVIDHCRKDLTSYKVPRQIEFRTELPKTNVGKILRRELRDS
ncbi:MAG: AMP-binding protein [Gammaproteobacteria bacterium]|nr:AMP-binding protein [Gammaproteobacteria bacterium]MBT3725513.1 AMP-binding protein [Gammaproteobacteria bacterium]MBT4076329.1 AMP-binding protein [Gammaproteobacteria bacterium]MBT4452317.1 AMP-binding protein [Gammaproteobacteria bacterium]MBT4859614.1 AMP-binding protein [Gammaproteobacteria bacterium]